MGEDEIDGVVPEEFILELIENEVTNVIQEHVEEDGVLIGKTE